MVLSYLHKNRTEDPIVACNEIASSSFNFIVYYFILFDFFFNLKYYFILILLYSIIFYFILFHYFILFYSFSYLLEPMLQPWREYPDDIFSKNVSINN